MVCDTIIFGSNQAGMAQSVAHFIGSEEVTGSIPVASLRKAEIIKISAFFIY